MDRMIQSYVQTGTRPAPTMFFRKYLFKLHQTRSVKETALLFFSMKVMSYLMLLQASLLSDAHFIKYDFN